MSKESQAGIQPHSSTRKHRALQVTLYDAVWAALCVVSAHERLPET
jgi:hypothetical protein